MGDLPWAAQYYARPWLVVGARVLVGERLGVVLEVDNYAHVRLDGDRHPVPWHPRDVEKAPDDAPPPPRHRHSAPHRVTEHTRRSEAPVTCRVCGGAITPGQRYRQAVSVQDEHCPWPFNLRRAHVGCVRGPEWEVTRG